MTRLDAYGRPRAVIPEGSAFHFDTEDPRLDTQQESRTAHISVTKALERLEERADKRFMTLFEHGTLQIEIYAPRGTDPQSPHSRDEVYVVAKGSGVYYNGSTRSPFQPGDILFAPAGTPHRFEEFSDDFVVWVLFYGPEGGEVNRTA